MEEEEKKEINTNDKMLNAKDKKLLTFNIIFIVCIFVGIFIYMIKVDGIDNIIKLLQTVNYRWVALGMACLLGMWISESFALHLLIKKIYPKQKFTNSIKVTMIGQLFNNITPFASGGQPMQAYELAKTGKRTSDAFSILMMRFIITQITLIALTIAIALIQFDFFAQVFSQHLVLGIVGVILNIFLVIALIFVGTKKIVVMKIGEPIIRFAAKIKIGKIRFVKDADEAVAHFEKSVENFNQQFKKMKKEKDLVFVITLIGLFQSALYYTITYTVYKAFGNTGATILQIIVLQTFLQLIMTVTPTPGAGLGAEGGFLILFNSIFAKGTINLSILFWRVYTFYLPILVGALFLIPVKSKKKEKKE